MLETGILWLRRATPYLPGAELGAIQPVTHELFVRLIGGPDKLDPAIRSSFRSIRRLSTPDDCSYIVRVDPGRRDALMSVLATSHVCVPVHRFEKDRPRRVILTDLLSLEFTYRSTLSQKRAAVDLFPLNSETYHPQNGAFVVAQGYSRDTVFICAGLEEHEAVARATPVVVDLLPYPEEREKPAAEPADSEENWLGALEKWRISRKQGLVRG